MVSLPPLVVSDPPFVPFLVLLNGAPAPAGDLRVFRIVFLTVLFLVVLGDTLFFAVERLAVERLTVERFPAVFFFVATGFLLLNVDL